ncbi:MAG: hypothetical protein ACFFDR_08310 [Candidatus Thorarchaeota archaeon]
MSPDNKRSDDYWMGVRDALRMVDSFLKWSRVNKDRAKSLEDFIYDGLVAAAKRCESCLHKELGLKFDSDVEEDILEGPILDDSFEEEDIEDDELPSDDFETTPPDIVLEPEGFEVEAEVSITIESDSDSPDIAVTPAPALEDGSVSIDSMGIMEGSVEDDTHVDGGAREFSSDFELVEPDHLIIDSTPDEIEDTEDLDSFESSEDVYVPEPPAEVKEEISVIRPKYSWEETVEPPIDDSSFEEPVSPADDETSKPAKVWSPMDEPSPSSLEDEESIEDDEDIESVSPPPPPPPPDTEECEEERRRRARRLFFGG